MEHFEIIWEAPEYDFHEKDAVWYWTSIIVAVLILGAALWQRNYLFALFVILAEILLIIWANKTPNVYRFILTEKGLKILHGSSPHKHADPPIEDIHRHYLFSHMKAFSVFEHDHSVWHDFVFHIDGRFHPHVKIKVPESHSQELQKLLRGIIPFVEHDETFTDILGHYLRF